MVQNISNINIQARKCRTFQFKNVPLQMVILGCLKIKVNLFGLSTRKEEKIKPFFFLFANMICHASFCLIAKLGTFLYKNYLLVYCLAEQVLMLWCTGRKKKTF